MPYPTGPVPKPTMLTPEVQAEIIEALDEGNYISVACDVAGLSYRAFRKWQERWENDDPEAEKFADFFMR
jgi:hypothetical protein